MCVLSYGLVNEAANELKEACDVLPRLSPEFVAFVVAFFQVLKEGARAILPSLPVA